jgi:hypothetical protein
MKRKPMYPSNLTPRELIGEDDYLFLKMHFLASLKITDPEKFGDKISKKFKERERASIVEILDRLKRFGFYPSRIDEKGEIVWGIVLRGDLQDYTEDKYPLKCDDCDCKKGVCLGYSKDEILNMRAWARDLKIIKSIEPDGSVS